METINQEIIPNYTHTDNIRGRVVAGDIKSFDIIVAHPDDEIYMLGFILDSLPSDQDWPSDFKINVHYLTNGEAGVDLTRPCQDQCFDFEKDLPRTPNQKAMLGNKRQMEAFKAWQSIFGDSIYDRVGLKFYGLPDSGLKTSDKLHGTVQNILASYAGNLVLLIDNYENHPDHQAVEQALQSTSRIVFGSGLSREGYENPKETISFELEMILRIGAFVSAHASQFGNDTNEIPGLVRHFFRANHYAFRGANQ